MENRKKMIVLAEAVVCSICLMIFSYFIQFDFPVKIIAFVALIAATYFISKNIKSVDDLKNIFGERSSARKIMVLIIIGFLFGIILSIPYRDYHDWDLLPKSIHLFTIVAALIGCMEELVYRGFLQEYVNKINGWFSILFSTISHTGYKCFLFLSPGIAENTPVGFLFFWTFGVGLVFGVSRYFTKSIWIALTAHIIFDVISYAEFTHAPWWV